MRGIPCILYVGLILLLTPKLTFGQQPAVTWSIYSDSVQGKSTKVIFKARVAPRWHLYSQFIEEGGPIPTSFSFEKGPYQRKDGVEEIGERTVFHDPVYDMKLSWYSNEVTFVQKIEVSTQATVKGVIEFMVCNNEVCMPGKKVFAVVVGRPQK